MDANQQLHASWDKLISLYSLLCDCMLCNWLKTWLHATHTCSYVTDRDVWIRIFWFWQTTRWESDGRLHGSRNMQKVSIQKASDQRCWLPLGLTILVICVSLSWVYICCDNKNSTNMLFIQDDSIKALFFALASAVNPIFGRAGALLILLITPGALRSLSKLIVTFAVTQFVSLEAVVIKHSRTIVRNCRYAAL